MPFRQLSAGARGCILTVYALGALVVAIAAPHVPTLDAPTVLLLLVLIALAEFGGLELFERSSYSISVVPTIAAGMLLGVPGAVVAAPASALIRGIRRRTRWYKVLFNASTYVLAAAAAAVVFDVLSPPLDPSSLLQLLPATAAAGIAYYLHTGIIAVGMATELRTASVQIWAAQFRWLWPHYVVLSLMGLILALAYSQYGVIGAAVFVIPPMMMRYVAKQYIDHTLEHVRQLRALNQQLEAEIAQRKATEQENVRLAQTAARADALEELNQLKSDFISIASHELRTPLTTILGFSELLLDQMVNDDPTQHFLSVIYEDAAQLSSLVDNLLDVSRIESGRMKVEALPVDLDQLLPPLVHVLGAQSSQHVLEVDIAPEARWVQADPDKLRQILSNLINNAIKYSPNGERVLIRARSETTMGQVAISVSDQGIGIATEHLERIFDRFQRVSGPDTQGIRGTGLGLYIVRQLVELHGGSVRVESVLGRGSTFHIALPAALAPLLGIAGSNGAESTPVPLVVGSRGPRTIE